MPTLADSTPDAPIKALCIGQSGTGKTGALASLALAGYKLHILDFDKGLTSRNALADVLKTHPEAQRLVNFESPADTIDSAKGLPRLKPPIHAYKDAGRILTEWDASSFTLNDILVLDTLTTFSEAAFNEALMLGGRLNQRPQLQDYGWMADSVKLFIEMITDPSFSCHVIVNTHIRWFAADEESQTQATGLPNAKGQEISRVVSRYFNSVLLYRTQGAGAGAKRMISTQPQGVVEVKTSSPSSVKREYPIDTGLASFFFDILGHGPTPQPKSPAKAQQPTAALTPTS